LSHHSTGVQPADLVAYGSCFAGLDASIGSVLIGMCRCSFFFFWEGGVSPKKKWCQHERVVVCLVGNLNQLQRVRKGPPLVSAAAIFVRIVSLKICCRNGSTMLDCWPGYRGMVGNGHKLFLLIADVPFLDSGDSVYCRIG